MKKPILAAAACAAVVASAALAAPATALGHGDPLVTVGTPHTVAKDLFSPLSLTVTRAGVSYVSQNFSGTLTQVNPDGSRADIASAPGEEIGAVSFRDGTVYFSQAAFDHSSSHLMALPEGGTPTSLADLWAHENAENPDQVNSYGFVDLPQECQDQFDPTAPATYSGIVDTHAYASLALSRAIYVADAGANAVVRVGYDGAVSTVAVLPASDPVTVTAEIAAEAGFPDCVAGFGYRFEPVPTDVELGPDGWLYVTSLPGGPTDASLGARGAVYKVHPNTGEVALVASGFVGATDLAVADGYIFVAELFGGPNGTGQVSVVRPGESEAAATVAVTSPATIELVKGTLYVTKEAFVPDETGAPQPIGKLVVVSLTGSGRGADSVH